jgi:hypothetical protein
VFQVTRVNPGELRKNKNKNTLGFNIPLKKDKRQSI